MSAPEVYVKLTPERSRYVANQDGDGSIERIQSEHDDLDAPLPSTYEISTYPADFTLELLVTKFEKKEIRVPPIQRRFVWSQAQSSKLIESFLLGLPVPPIYFYQDRKDNTLLVVDGQQRLRSIVFFFKGLFGEPIPGQKKQPQAFTLTGLNDKSPYLGVTYESLKENNLQAFNRLQNSVLRAFVMKQLDPNDDTSIFQIFERLNTGGVILQGQEIRNCIYEGTFNDLLTKLNLNQKWRDIFGKAQPDKRLRDVELILRFLALHYNIGHYAKPMKKFLNDFMKTNRRAQPERLKEFRDLFTQTTDRVVESLGTRPFNIRRGLNAAVYDSVFTAFAKHLGQTHHSLSVRFTKLKDDADYLASVTSATTDDEVVPKRLQKAEQILFG